MIVLLCPIADSAGRTPNTQSLQSTVLLSNLVLLLKERKRDIVIDCRDPESVRPKTDSRTGRLNPHSSRTVKPVQLGPSAVRQLGQVLGQALSQQPTLNGGAR